MEIKDKISYGAASLGDTILYNILTVYLVYYLTEIAGMQVSLAGFITAIAMVWNTVFVVIVGYLSDLVLARYGERVSIMKISTPLMCAFFVALFLGHELSQGYQPIYFCLVLILLWSSHSSYMVPYEAVGGEITSSSRVQISLRNYARLFMSFGNIFALVLFTYLVGKLQTSFTLTEGEAWIWGIVLLTGVSAISFVVTNRMVDHNEIHSRTTMDRPSWMGMAKEYAQMARLPHMSVFLGTSLILSVINVVFSTNIVYFMKYNMGMGEDKRSYIFLILSFTGLFATFFFSYLSRHLDKRTIMVASFALTALIMMLYDFKTVDSIRDLGILIAVYTIGNSAYWQFIYSMGYDLGHGDQARTGKKRQGSIMSINKVIYKISGAVGIQIYTVILSMEGYQQNLLHQSENVSRIVSSFATIIPAALFLIAALVVLKFPKSGRE